MRDPRHIDQETKDRLNLLAEQAALIQTLVDALDGLVEDRGGIIVAMRRSHKALAAAEAAGFKPTDG